MTLLVDNVLPEQPMRQWVLSFPFQLRFLFASRPALMGQVLGIVYRVIATHLIHQAGLTKAYAHTGAVTLIQRFGSALTNSPGAILSPPTAGTATWSPKPSHAGPTTPTVVMSRERRPSGASP